MQKLRILLNTEVAPITKARRSVRDVIVIAIPLFCIMETTISIIEDFDNGGASAIPDISMNKSSIPIPEIFFSVS